MYLAETKTAWSQLFTTNGSFDLCTVFALIYTHIIPTVEKEEDRERETTQRKIVRERMIDIKTK